MASIVNSLMEPFKDEEECRIAHVIYEALLCEKLEQPTLKNWIKSFNFSLESNEDFYRLATFKSILAYLYFHSLDTLKLDADLEKAMLAYLKEY